MKNADYGKMIALRKAGWSGREIAEEMRMTDGEYCDAVAAKLEEIDAWIGKLEREYRKYASLITGS